MSRTVLLVDDTQTVRMFEKFILGALGYSLLEAENGQKAFDLAKEKKPDLVLLDVNMPVMDGLTCCRKLKEDPATQSIPVIMVTTKGEQSQIDEGFSAGCDDYVTKPIRKIELLAKIKQQLGE